MKQANISFIKGPLLLNTSIGLLIFFTLFGYMQGKEKEIKQNNSKIDIMEAINLIKNEIDDKSKYQNKFYNLDQRNLYKIILYDKSLDKGTKIRQANSNENLIICRNKSLLFFIDEVPWAHFSHPVRIGIIDITNNNIIIKKAEWWPVVDGKPYFLDNNQKLYHTFSFNSIGSQKLKKQNQLDECNCDSINIDEYDGSIYKDVVGKPLSKNEKLWAIIILGGLEEIRGNNRQLAYDADGMYSILNSYKVSKDHIYYFKKRTKDFKPLDNDVNIYSTCLNVKSITMAINDIQSKIKESDKFLFFISAHGGKNCKLFLSEESKPFSIINDCHMQMWLSRIRCKRIFVIINSCYSGSFIYGDANIRRYEYNLSIPEDKNNNRVVITSCSHNERSPADIDSCDSNIEDRGSEFIGGFFEAFTNKEADIDCNKRISIGEAFDYAKKYAACGGGSLATNPYTPIYTPLIRWSSPTFEGKSITPYKEYLFEENNKLNK